MSNNSPHEQSIEEWIARLESIKSSVLNASPAHDDAYGVTYYVSGELWATFPGEIDNAIALLKDVQRSVLRDFYNEVCDRAEEKMAMTHKLEGAHFAAMTQVLKRIGVPTDRDTVSSYALSLPSFARGWNDMDDHWHVDGEGNAVPAQPEIYDTFLINNDTTGSIEREDGSVEIFRHGRWWVPKEEGDQP